VKKGDVHPLASAPMRLRHIEVFNAIYLSGTISAAARLLNVSQPSLSKTLQHAEDQLGFKLFRRVRGRLLPTDEAHVVYRESREVYKKLETLQRACRSLRAGEAGQLRIASIHAAGLTVVPAAIARFRRQHPSVTFDIRTEHQEESLRALFDRVSEVAVVWGADLPPRVTGQCVGRGELVLVHPKGAFPNASARVPITALADHDVVGITRSGPIGTLLNTKLTGLADTFREIVAAHTFFVAAALVREGVGMTVVDELTARAVGGERTEFRRLDPAIPFEIHAVHLEDRPPSHLATKFIDELRKELERTLRP
jgi:DNA-binding transcriptional LysR family regulator